MNVKYKNLPGRPSNQGRSAMVNKIFVWCLITIALFKLCLQKWKDEWIDSNLHALVLLTKLKQWETLTTQMFLYEFTYLVYM